MKYLVLLAVIAVAYAIWRSRRRPLPPDRPMRQQRGTAPQDMVACAHCGVHLPHGDALPAGTRYYCCAAHREQGPA